MGEVYRGWDDKLDRPVALKRIAPDAANAEEARAMFRREARAVARLHHGSIVQVFELIEGEDGDWLVMELVDGKSLRELCGGKRIQPGRVAEIARGICTGLAAAHDAGIVHRDLKLDNVMLTATGEVKILDFGIYKRLDGDDVSSMTQTLSVDGRLVGTVTAMSPEQAAGEEIDHRSDLFSLGSLLYELLTGVPPFVGKTSHETLSRICLRQETPVHELVPEVSESFSALVSRLLEKGPARRPQSAEQVQQMLAEVTMEMSGMIPVFSRGDHERFDPAPGTGMPETEPPSAAPAPTGALPTSSGPTVRTLLLNDLVDSTKWVETLGDERAAQIFEQHDRMAREILKATDGREIDKSDGFLMLFERPMDAVRFALGYHAALEEISAREGVTVSSRVGIHVGEVVLRENSAEDVARGAKPLEVEGLAKAMAARFMTLAGARQTLISRGVYDLGKRAAVGALDLPEGLRWVAHGRYTMKGVAEPVRVCEVGVAGSSPFSAPADTKKVKRVKEVSGRLSGWRLRAAVAAALVVVTLAGLGARQLWLMRELPPPHYVAVPPTEIADDGGGDLRLKASVIQAGLIRAIQGYAGAAPIEPAGRNAEIDDPQILALATGADEVLLSRLECSASTCQVVLKRIEGSDDRVVWNHRFIDRTRSLLDLTHLAAEQLRGGFQDFEVREGVSELQVRPEDYDEFWRVNRRFLNREAGADLEAILADLRRLRESSPRFSQVYRLEADILRLRFTASRAAEDLEAAIALLDRALEIGPGQPRVLRSLARAQIEAGRLDEAEQTLQEIARIEPGDAELFILRATILERRSRPAEALTLMRQSVDRLRSADQLANLADMEYRMGQVDNARANLEAALDLDPENFEILSRLAQLEIVDGSVERSAELYEVLVERMPELAELSNLGVAYLLLKRYGDAAGMFERALERAPASPQSMLNLADARRLLGEDEAAMDLYEKTVELIRQDPDPDVLLTVEGQALAHLDRHQEAIAAVQKALRLRPDNPQVIYESALVYSLVGEKTSALLHARRALELGLEKRWFELAWFDSIRSELEGEERS